MMGARSTRHGRYPLSAENHERAVDCERPLRTLHAPAPPTTENHEGVAAFANSQDAPHGYPPKTARGCATRVQNSHGATTRAIRHARNPQRVRRATWKFARRRNESDSTRKPRRVFAGAVENSHNAATRTIRHAQSPQTVRRQSDSTCTIPAAGSPATLKIHTAPQRERFDTRDPRRGFAGDVENSRGATARAM